MILLLLITQTLPQWETPLEIYRPLTHRFALTIEDGRSFVIDPTTCVISAVDANGVILSTFGGKGEGPGERQGVLSLYGVGERLYVMTLHALHVFEFQGTFIYRKATTHQRIPHKVEPGWLIERKRFDRRLRVTEFIHETSSVRSLVKAEEPTPARAGRAGDPIIHYSPVPDRFLWAINRARTHLAYRSRGGHQVTLVAFATGGEDTLDPEFAILPMSTQWADAKFERWKRKQNIDATFVLRPQETFPVISWMNWRADGLLGVYQRGEEEGRYYQSRFFNTKGRIVSGPLISPKWDKFILRIGPEGTATVLTYNGEHLLLARHPIKGLGGYLNRAREAWSSP